MVPVFSTVLFTVLVPGTVAGLVPWFLRAGSPVAPSQAARLTGAAALLLGLAVYLHTAFWGFALRGRGTPAPIAPTRHLVVEGLHRRVRNPMYLGVLLMVLGQASLFWSSSCLLYAGLLGLTFHGFVLLYEEPTLRAQFGSEYDEYRRRVPRWVPRLGPPG
jgi:protein-S-isoprenylcysteine O-methyltransferase Ste14